MVGEHPGIFKRPHHCLPVVSLEKTQDNYTVTTVFFVIVLIKTAFHTFLPVFRGLCMPVRVSLCVTHPLTQL